MFEIRDAEDPTHLHTVVDSLDDVDQALEALADLTRTQLLANGEGSTNLWLRTVVYRPGDTDPCLITAHAI